MEMKQDSKKETNNWLEQLVTIIASILVIFTFVFLIYHLINDKETPADIVVSFGEVIEKSGGFSIKLSVENQGTETAKDVTIEITTTEDSVAEKGQVSFQYIPGESTVKGWVNFKKKPNPQSLESHVLGYSIP